METFWIIFAFIWCIVWGALSASIMHKKGYENGDVVMYFLFGFFLTFIGAILAYSKEDIAKRNREIYERAKLEKEKETLRYEAASLTNWRCSCGAMNKEYETSCHRCGKLSPSVAASKPQPSAADVSSDLKKFKEMLDEGLITEEEFTAKKKQILGI